jgi:hypothetical protein
MAALGSREKRHETFWELAEPYLAAGQLVEGTMMGHPCLREASTNGFVATVERSSGNLVVKLPDGRVQQLIDDGVGRPFAPAGKVFSEWVTVAEADEKLWIGLIEESIDYIGSNAD